MVKKHDYVGLVKYHNDLADAARQLKDNDMLIEHQMAARGYLFFKEDPVNPVKASLPTGLHLD
jgi:hypothetical protein